MSVVWLISLLTLLVLLVLGSAYCGAAKYKGALIFSTCSLVIGGALLACALLPHNSFYGKTIYCARTQEKLIALTFDDGPYPPYTEDLLRTLKELKVPVTFFLVGENAKRYPAVVRTIAEEGHAMGVHAYQHRDLLRLSTAEITADLRRAQSTIESISAKPVTLFRPPHGFRDGRVMEAAKACNLMVVTWSVMARDWTNPGRDTIVRRILEKAEPGSIVLLHDGDSPRGRASREQTVAAVPLIVASLRQAGYEFVTVPELMRRTKAQEQKDGKT